MRNGNRTIKVNKNKLIEQIKENKAAHIIEYGKAVKAYKLEALAQLEKLTSRAQGGNLRLRLDLTTPVDSSSNYDDILEMFTWEVEDIVELDQNEFKEYVQDKTSFALSAKSSNTMYFANHGM